MTNAGALYIHNGTLILPDRLVEDGALLCRDGRIAVAGKRNDVPPPEDAQRVDARGGYISPGFIDIHTHGGAACDYMDGDADGTRLANRAHARHGTTSIFPTTTTGTPQRIAAMLDSCARVQKSWTVADGARIAGVHLYGPYFASDKIGAHPKGLNRDPDPAEYLPYLKDGLVRVATCAAELPGADTFYRAAREAGCLVTCGHSNASWSEMARGYAAGMRHVDHFWSAMSSVPSMRTRLGTPMQGSMEQFVIRHEEMSTEVIADGQHLAPELLEYAYHTKGARRLCLVTDCSRAMDAPPGVYMIGPREQGEPFIFDGTVARLPNGGLASSAVGMDVMVRNMHRAGIALQDVVRMASLTPAERTGMDRDIGSLAAGKRADFQLLTKDLQVGAVYMDGVLFQSSASRER